MNVCTEDIWGADLHLAIEDLDLCIPRHNAQDLCSVMIFLAHSQKYYFYFEGLKDFWNQYCEYAFVHGTKREYAWFHMNEELGIYTFHPKAKVKYAFRVEIPLFDFPRIDTVDLLCSLWGILSLIGCPDEETYRLVNGYYKANSDFFRMIATLLQQRKK